ncbi:hypothetical protein HDV00_003626 [Rhizophlyctis rosea]|nr:hypothetical protein HDV00_003626 [Rhizophlyctis rosea]
MLSPNFGKAIRVLLLDPIPLAALRNFEAAHYEVDECFGDLSEADLVRRIGDYNVVCIERTKGEAILTDEVLRSAHRLLAIGVMSNQASQVHWATARSMGIPVFTSPYQRHYSVAEMIISTIILLARQLLDRSRECHAGEWNKTSTNCHEVRGKTLGIIGYGHVGSQLGVLAEALSLRVLFYDSIALMPIGRAQPVDTLDQLLSQSDYVALNVSPAPENVKMIAAEQLAKMKPNSYLINASFADAVDIDALAEALKSKHLAGAAIDVFPSAPTAPTAQFPTALQNCPNVIISPNISDQTDEAQQRVAGEVTQSIVSYISDGTTHGAVDFPSIAAWPLKAGNRRILNLHRNVRGVLKEIDNILAPYNVQKQVLDTTAGPMGIGYIIADVSTENVATEIVSQLAMLANTIRTRIL